MCGGRDFCRSIKRCSDLYGQCGECTEDLGRDEVSRVMDVDDEWMQHLFSKDGKLKEVLSELWKNSQMEVWMLPRFEI